MTSYTRRRYSSSPRRQPGQPDYGPRVNRFAGDCSKCGVPIPANAGLLTGGPGAWTVEHKPAEWSGSPVSGWYINGCPADTARLNADGGWGPESARTYTPAATAEPVRCESGTHPSGPHAATDGCEYPHNAGYAPEQVDPADAREMSRRAGSKYAYTADGARMTMSSQRCIDAPCCGCC